MEFTTRAYNSFALNPKTKASIIKTSEEERLKGEAEYYLELPNDLKVFFPRMIDCDLTPPYSMELELYAYDNLGNVMVSSSYHDNFWEKTFDFLLGYINAYKESESIPANREDSLLMFVDKTEFDITETIAVKLRIKNEEQIEISPCLYLKTGQTSFTGGEAVRLRPGEEKEVIINIRPNYFSQPGKKELRVAAWTGALTSGYPIEQLLISFKPIEIIISKTK